MQASARSPIITKPAHQCRQGHAGRAGEIRSSFSNPRVTEVFKVCALLRIFKTCPSVDRIPAATLAGTERGLRDRASESLSGP